MKTEKVLVDDLHHPEKNVRVHTPNQIQEIYRSVEMFGQIRPVVIDEDNTILAGNGLVQAYRENGEEYVEVLKMKNLSENDKKKLMIADNRTYALGFDDNDAIFEILGELDGDFDVPGYEEEMLESLMADEEDVNEEVENFGKIEDEDREEFERKAELKEKRIERAEQQEQDEPTEQPNTYQADEYVGVETPNASDQSNAREVGVEQKVIKCPHCGEEFTV